jgi:hypothetical protein
VNIFVKTNGFYGFSGTIGFGSNISGDGFSSIGNGYNNSSSDSGSVDVNNSGKEIELIEVPSLGDSWTNQVMHRVILRAVCCWRIFVKKNKLLIKKNYFCLYAFIIKQ